MLIIALTATGCQFHLRFQRHFKVDDIQIAGLDQVFQLVRNSYFRRGRSGAEIPRKKDSYASIRHDAKDLNQPHKTISHETNWMSSNCLNSLICFSIGCLSCFK